MNLLLAALTTVTLGAPPEVLVVQGQLNTDAGVAVDGGYGMKVTLYDGKDAVGGLWTKELASVPVINGIFRLNLDGISAALLTDTDPWFGVQVGAEPELPRQRLKSVPFALVASVATALACSGCITQDMLDAGLLDELGGTDYTDDLAIAAVKNSGQFLLVGDASLYNDGMAVQAVVDSGLFFTKGDLNSAIPAELLPADGLDEVSGNLISTTFTDEFVSQDTPVDIKDQFPPGIQSTITVPNVGIAQSFEVDVTLSGHSDVSELKITLFAPSGDPFVLFEGTNAGATGLDLTFPTPAVPVTGDLTQFVDTNIVGDWHLEVVDNQFDTNTIDGALDTWRIRITTLSNQKLHVLGDLYADEHQIKALAPPTEPGDATNKAYVDASFKDRVHTLAPAALGPGEEAILVHGAGTEMIFTTAWFKAPNSGLWSQTGAAVAGEDLGGGANGTFNPQSNTTLSGGSYEYSSVNIPAGVTVTVTGPDALIIRSQGTITIAGTLDLAGKAGHTVTSTENSAGGAGGGGGGAKGGLCNYSGGSAQPGSGPGGGGKGINGGYGGGGGGAGHASKGSPGTNGANGEQPGQGGDAYNSLDAGSIAAGSGGGAGAYGSATNSAGGGGGGGGGAVKLVAPEIAVTGAITAAGGAGGSVKNSRDGGAGGGGSGGSIWLVGGVVNAVGGTINATGGIGGNTNDSGSDGGVGGNGSPGRVRIDAFTINGSSNPIFFTGTETTGINRNPLRVYQPDNNSVAVQNNSFVPLDVRLLVIVP